MHLLWFLVLVWILWVLRILKLNGQRILLLDIGQFLSVQRQTPDHFTHSGDGVVINSIYLLLILRFPILHFNSAELILLVESLFPIA